MGVSNVWFVAHCFIAKSAINVSVVFLTVVVGEGNGRFLTTKYLQRDRRRDDNISVDGTKKREQRVL